MPAVTEDTGRATPKAPPARLWWIMLARAAAVMGILAGVLVLARIDDRPRLPHRVALGRMGRVFGQAQG
jgi:hypothetical protein